jgi:hypothetical protein
MTLHGKRARIGEIAGFGKRKLIALSRIHRCIGSVMPPA